MIVLRIFAADIGGTAIKYCIANENGLLEYIGEVPTESHKGGQAIIQKVVDLISAYSKVDAISISTAGQVNNEEGYIIYANENIPGYTGTRIKEMLEKEFQVPVKVENDVNSAALGEKHFGIGKQFEDFLFLTFGTGIGGAIVINNKLYRGFNGIAGEFGHMITHTEGLLCNCGHFGCYECYGSTRALVREANKINPNCTDGRILFEMIEKGDQGLYQVFQNWAKEVAIGIVSLVHIFNPPCIIIGGGVMEQSLAVEQVSKYVRERIMPSYADVKILKSQLGNRAGLYGAISLQKQ